MRKLYLLMLSMIVATGLFAADYVDLYVRGAQFGWKPEECTSANKMTTTDGNIYTISLDQLQSGFKISDASWSNGYNFGSVNNIAPGNTYTVVNDGGSGDMTTVGTAPLYNVTLTLNINALTLKVEGTAGTVEYPAALYLAGDFNNWTAGDAQYKLSRQGTSNKYSISNVNIEAGKFIKVCTEGWTNSWGPETKDEVLPIGTSVPLFLNFNETNFKLGTSLTNASIEFTYNLNDPSACTLLVTNQGGGGNPGTDPGTGSGDFSGYYVNVFGPFNNWEDNGTQPNAEGITTTTDLHINSDGFKVKIWNGSADIYYIANDAIPLDKWTQMTEDPGGAPNATIQGASATTVYTVKYNLNTNQIFVTLQGGGGNPGTDPGTGSGDFNGYYVNVFGPFNNWEDNGTQPNAEGITTTTDLPINSEGFKVKIWNGSADIYYIANDAIPLDKWTQMTEDPGGAPNATIQGASATTVYTVKYNLNTNQIYVTLQGGGGNPGTDPTPDPTAPVLYVRGEFTGDWAALDDYKMTCNGNVYTLSGINIPANQGFKVSDATWTVNFGGTGDPADESITTCTIENGVPADAWYNSSVNYVLTEALTNATITFTYNPDTTVPSIFKVEGTVNGGGGGDNPGTDPTPDPTAPVLYVRGEFTGDWAALDDYKMTCNGNVYTLSGINIPANQGFKVSDATWTVNFGGTGDPNDESITTCTIENGVPADAWYNSSVNYVLTEALTNATITFTYNPDTTVPSTFKVEGTVNGGGGGDNPGIDPTPDPTAPVLYVRGEFTGWEALDAYKMTCNGNVYTLNGISLAANSEWKIGDATWTVNFGGTGDPADESITTCVIYNDVPTDAWYNSSVNFYVTEDMSDVTISLVYNSDTTLPSSITVKGNTTGIDGVYSNDSEVEYYNMQGVRVNNPENGIYIVKRGNQVTKEVIRK